MTITRQFKRPHHHDEQAMEAELTKLPATWRIYGTVRFPSGRHYHVEFRVPDDDVTALDAALEKLA